MAAPQIRFKRGAQSNLPALAAGEPAFVNDEYNLYLGLDGTSGNNKFLGSARYWVKETATTGHAVKLYSRTDGSGGGSVSLAAPDTASNLELVLPSSDGGAGNVLVTDGSGNLSFSAPAADPELHARDYVEGLCDSGGRVHYRNHWGRAARRRNICSHVVTEAFRSR